MQDCELRYQNDTVCGEHKTLTITNLDCLLPSKYNAACINIIHIHVHYNTNTSEVYISAKLSTTQLLINIIIIIY